MSDFDLRDKIENGLRSFWVSLPVGILFLALGMEVNLREAWANKSFLVVICIAATSAKLMGFWVSTRKLFNSLSERFFVILGILSQGEMGLLIGAYLFSRGVLYPSTFNVAVTIVVILTVIVPILMKIVSNKLDVDNAFSQMMGVKKQIIPL